MSLVLCLCGCPRIENKVVWKQRKTNVSTVRVVRTGEAVDGGWALLPSQVPPRFAGGLVLEKVLHG